MVRLEQVTKRLEHRTILKNVNLHIKQGECAAILGQNGAGKSTLLKLIATLMAPTEGTIYVQGQPLAEAEAGIRKQIGYVFHQSSFYPHLTATENLKLVCQWYGIADAPRKISDALEKVRLRLAKEEKVQHFSRGMVQRLAIARVLLIEATLLLLDEPHTGLDQDSMRWLNALIQERVANGVTVLMVSHDLAQVKELADRVLWLEQGRMIKDLRRGDVGDPEFQRQVSNG